MKICLIKSASKYEKNLTCLSLILAQFFFIFVIVSYFFTTSVHAQNNIFGFHLSTTQINDVNEISQIVNSNGGDWGYITFVVQLSHRNASEWQEIFNTLREKHLIPIVRIATGASGNYWERAKESDIDEWVRFLNSLNWPVKERYIILFNEPNHGSEWGGECDPRNYAKISKIYSQKIKESHPDYFIMLAGLDQTAPNNRPKYCSESTFLQEMVQEEPNIFDFVDGLSSHSYPNPGFVASPHEVGRGSVRGYEWELNEIRNLGISKNLPVFLTEAGWPTGNGYFSEAIVANYLNEVISNYWSKDSRVRAFTLFDYHIGGALKWFSIKQENGQKDAIISTLKSLPKKIGSPTQNHVGIFSSELPKKYLVGQTITANISIQNIGQSIWNDKEQYSIDVLGMKVPIEKQNQLFVKPFEKVIVPVNFTPVLGTEQVKIVLKKNNQIISDIGNWQFEVVKPPAIEVKVSDPTLNEPTRVEIFDETEKLVFERQVEFIQGNAIIDDFLIGEVSKQYRLVVLRPKYLPKQSKFIFSDQNNSILFERLLGVDLNMDGKFSIGDFF